MCLLTKAEHMCLLNQNSKWPIIWPELCQQQSKVCAQSKTENGEHYFCAKWLKSISFKPSQIACYILPFIQSPYTPTSITA